MVLVLVATDDRSTRSALRYALQHDASAWTGSRRVQSVGAGRTVSDRTDYYGCADAEHGWIQRLRQTAGYAVRQRRTGIDDNRPETIARSSVPLPPAG